MNMSYCRFENTLRDIRDCYDNMEGSVNEREFEMRKQLVGMCMSIADEYKHLLEEDFVEEDY